MSTRPVSGLSISLLALLFCLVGATSAMGQAKYTAGLTVEKTWAGAVAKAKAEGRLVFLMFVQDDCKHCDKFSENVLRTETFRNFARDHLAIVVYDYIKLVALPESERKVAEQIEERIKVDVTPTIVVYDGNLKQLLRTKGYRGASAEKVVGQLRSKLGDGG